MLDINTRQDAWCYVSYFTFEAQTYIKLRKTQMPEIWLTLWSKHININITNLYPAGVGEAHFPPSWIVFMNDKALIDILNICSYYGGLAHETYISPRSAKRFLNKLKKLCSILENMIMNDNVSFLWCDLCRNM